jgi:uncharacterized protein YecE (DUF72 family)
LLCDASRWIYRTIAFFKSIAGQEDQNEVFVFATLARRLSGAVLYCLMSGVYVGTSGWYYKDWHASFYPKELRKGELLSYYARHFPTVEINASFYRLLSEKAVTDWVGKVPRQFIFSVKGSRFITHMKKLVDVDQGLDRFFERTKGFGNLLGPILWQLPGMLHKDASRLVDFLDRLPKRMRHAVEFRHPSWLDDEVFELLKAHRVAFVWTSSLAMPQVFAVTTDFVFLRFHGLTGGASHDYRRAELEPWAKQTCQQSEDGRAVFAYFNNDLNARAPENARVLMEMVEPHTIYPSEKETTRSVTESKRELAVH